jgi:hypothetical protein
MCHALTLDVDAETEAKQSPVSEALILTKVNPLASGRLCGLPTIVLMSVIDKQSRRDWSQSVFDFRSEESLRRRAPKAAVNHPANGCHSGTAQAENQLKAIVGTLAWLG